MAGLTSIFEVISQEDILLLKRNKYSLMINELGGTTIFLADYHVHPNYSIDAEDYSIDQYCQRAIELGLDEICFTTHFESDPARAHLDWFVRCHGEVVPMNGNWVEEYLREIEQAAQSYSTAGLKVKAGIEIGYDLGLEESIAHIIDYPFDFVLGSVHCVDHVAISSARESLAYFSSRNIDDIAEKYFKTLEEGVKTGFFNVIGHLDLYRRHGFKFFGTQATMAHRGRVEHVLREMSRRDIGLEINTSSIKHGQTEFYPCREIVGMAVEAGINIFTTGSDSHRLTELGRGIKAAVAMLTEMGITPTNFKQKTPYIGNV